MTLPYTFATLNLTSYQKDANNNYILPGAALDDNFSYVLSRIWVNTTAPGDTDKYPFWLDTSTTPNTLKIWNGTSWVLFQSASPTTQFQKARIYRATSQTILGGTFTKVLYNWITYDPNGIVDIANSRIKPTKEGYYLVSASVRFYVQSGGEADFTITLYKSNNQFSIILREKALYYEHQFNGSDLIYLDGSNDYVEIYVYHNGTGGTIYGQENMTYFSVVGPF